MTALPDELPQLLMGMWVVTAAEGILVFLEEIFRTLWLEIAIVLLLLVFLSITGWVAFILWRAVL